ncbi:HK97 family phage prohead protease [Desulfosporosinus sp. PR]|uniref:HK97 family phage prohead protease n=1 Tax=Candidatus Desulfosporosinus nitrosoreducens TaxID=3401928 RepID=UPI0027FD7E59|nr:HK97 family phage prohead protease [Desulfosporosinus sp. PR]MDQ7095950.1 HK97 family phage prohead protease [Desulfosporosinus sp. PR]
MGKKNKFTGKHIEERAFAMPDLTTAEEGNVIQGHAAVFGQTTNMYGCWNETIARGSFDNTDFTDVLFSINHDLSKIPLARSRNNNANSTLQLQVDDQGLSTRAALDTENNSEAKALHSAVERGDINGMSFIFSVRNDEWTGLDTDMPSRTITDIAKVYEVSAVSFPAYTGTDISARDATALESAKKVLENARAKELESSASGKTTEERSDLELERFKAELLLKL